MLTSKRKLCLCRVLPTEPEFQGLEKNRDYQFVVIDDRHISERAFMVVFLSEERYLSFSEGKFKQFMEIVP